MNQNIGIFGGTFDPPHISHTLACLYVLETTDLDRIHIIPCYRHPLGKAATSFEHRVAMTRLAMESLRDRVEISEMEAEREGSSYTIDTLRILRERMPDAHFSLIIGSDILKETRQWKSFDEIQRIAPLIILPRPQFASEGVRDFRFFLPDISSTEIRRRLSAGEDVTPYLSRRVLDYIRQHNLYQSLKEPLK